MVYAIIGLVVLASIAAALYFSIRSGELAGQVSSLQAIVQEQEADFSTKVEQLSAELSAIKKYSHIPNIMERARTINEEVKAKEERARAEGEKIVEAATLDATRLREAAEARLEQARLRADDYLLAATEQAKEWRRQLTSDQEAALARAEEAVRVAKFQAANHIEAAQKEAKELLKKARKEAKEKTQQVEETLDQATAYAHRIRAEAEERAEDIGGEAYHALRRHDYYESTAQAMRNTVEGYKDVYTVPSEHILDELAEEFSFDKSGERLKIARERTRVMQKNGTAASCNYPDGWKKEYAINFVLSAFNGKVDSILARVKPSTQGKLIQEIKDAYCAGQLQRKRLQGCEDSGRVPGREARRTQMGRRRPEVEGAQAGGAAGHP